tara:strand:- start:692 stop:874 length:183 start_codon:yes stop_codon:yes gene_type:complete
MKYYIAVVNDTLHMKEWKKLKTNLQVSGYSYVVYFDYDIKEIELNEVTKDVFKQMAYCEN